jgi:glycosyltransferase involved in cell wall biosynthesis
MKLLIITQVVDSNHPILGFFHRWIEEFSKHCSELHVICLEEGAHSLPAHVTVHSLGKESGKGRFTYLARFFYLIWSLRHQYDNVFVHMNQIYVILGAPVWRVLGKKIGLWYAHGTVSTSLKLAERCTDIIFTCSKDSFRLPTTKVLVTGHGINTELFSPQTIVKDIDLVTVGRITESKNLDVLVEILSDLRKTHKVTLTIVGVAVTNTERLYQKRLEELIKLYNLTDSVRFIGKVSQADLPSLLLRAKIFVTTAKNGSLDKAMLEPMALGLPIISMAPGSNSLPLGENQVTSQKVFTKQIQKVLESAVFEKPEYVEYVRSNHSLGTLVPRIISNFRNLK